MTLVKRTEEVPAVAATTREVEECFCDLCSARVYSERWDRPGYKIDNVAIHMETGSSYGSDGSCIDAIVVDCCEGCFKSKVLPALEAIGFKPREEDRSW
jgi:hypothetical protein